MGHLCCVLNDKRKEKKENKVIFPDEINIEKEEIDYKNTKFTYKEAFNFIPQIEIKFNDVKEITKELINDLINKLNLLFQGKDIKIISMKKGSLYLALALNYLIQESMQNINTFNISSDELLRALGDSLNLETSNVKDMIQDNLVICQQDKEFKPDFVNKNLMDLTSEESKDQLSKSIKKHFLEHNQQNDIFEISKNITPDDIKKFFNELIKETKTQQDDLYDIILNNEFQEYLQFFESEFEKAIKNSIFEYNIKFIAYIYRNDEKYKTGKLHCNNLIKKIVFHGTKSWAISRILAGNFRHANTHFFGIGVYFTDLLDYAWFYAAETDSSKFGNVGVIPGVNNSFSFIASEIYFDNTKFEQVYNMDKSNEIVPKNGVRHVCVNYQGQPIHKNELSFYNGFLGTEYIITEEDQILPLLNVTVERVEFLIVWRDNNFDCSNPNGYSNFNEIYNYNLQIKKYAAFNFKTKIYYFNESDEALNFIKRKKFNKIILITNGNNDGIGFINNARKIIGNNTISLITCYVANNYMNDVKNNENILLTSKSFDCIKKFINLSINKKLDDLKKLQKDIENNLKNIDNSFNFPPLTSEAFRYPYFKNGGSFSELIFD